MLTLTFLGVGSAFAKQNDQSNALIEAWTSGPHQQSNPDETLFIDFGATATQSLDSLRRQPGFEYLGRSDGIDFGQILRVFITHLHHDHVGGLEELAIQSRYGSGGNGARKPTLIGSETLLTALWEKTLRGGLEVLAGRCATMEDYFSLQKLRHESTRWLSPFRFLDRYEFQPFATNHLQLAVPFDWPSYGLKISDRQSGAFAVFSGDTRFDPEFIVPLMEDGRIAFHEVQLTASENPVHSLLSELRTIDPKVRGKMHLYHFEDRVSFGDRAIAEHEFAGFCKSHCRYTLFI